MDWIWTHLFQSKIQYIFSLFLEPKEKGEQKCYLQPLDQVAGSKVVRDEGPGCEPLDRTRGGRSGSQIGGGQGKAQGNGSRLKQGRKRGVKTKGDTWMKWEVEKEGGRQQGKRMS